MHPAGRDRASCSVETRGPLLIMLGLHLLVGAHASNPNARYLDTYYGSLGEAASLIIALVGSGIHACTLH